MTLLWSGCVPDVACARHECTHAVVDAHCWGKGPLVTVADVASALGRMYRSTSADALAAYPLAAQVLVCSVVHALHPQTPQCPGTTHGAAPASPPRPRAVGASTKQLTLAALRSVHNTMCKTLVVRPPDGPAFQELVERLCADGVISVSKGNDASKRCVTLSIDVTDIASVMSSNPIWAHV